MARFLRTNPIQKNGIAADNSKNLLRFAPIPLLPIYLMLPNIQTIRTALRIYGAMNRHEYDLVDTLRGTENGSRLRFHRAVTAVQRTEGLAAPLVLAKAAREREKVNLLKAKEMPRWTVRNALRLMGDRYREAVGMARNLFTTEGANTRNRQTIRRALRFYGNLWRDANPVPVGA